MYTIKIVLLKTTKIVEKMKTVHSVQLPWLPAASKQFITENASSEAARIAPFDVASMAKLKINKMNDADFRCNELFK